MVYRLNRRSSTYSRTIRKVQAKWQVAILAGIFGLGLMAGAFTGIKQSGVMTSLRDVVQGGDKVAYQDLNQDSKLPNGTTSKKPNSKVKGASTNMIGGITVADEVRASNACGVVGAKRSGLTTASMAQLRKLAEYEDVCGGSFISRISFFVGMPKTDDAARSDAAWVSDVLKELSGKGIAPIVFMEPATDGSATNFAAMDTYFATLKSKGVTDAMMGTWVPYPEANIPVWGTVDPNTFSSNVTKAVQAQKKSFPASKAAVLLQTMTYPHANDWAGGAYVSLRPYVQGIPKGLVDSFGLQGFPWPPTSPEDSAQLDPTKFLRADFTREAADILGAKEVWFNTGTFAKSVVVSKTKPYTLTPQQRQAILDGILVQAKALKGQGFSVGIHMFNEDKSGTEEGIDWSYWAKGKASASASTAVFKTFASDASIAGIPLWLYDND